MTYPDCPNHLAAANTWLLYFLSWLLSVTNDIHTTASKFQCLLTVAEGSKFLRTGVSCVEVLAEARFAGSQNKSTTCGCQCLAAGAFDSKQLVQVWSKLELFYQKECLPPPPPPPTKLEGSMFYGDLENVAHAYHNYVKVTIYINLFMWYYTHYEI